MEEFVKVNIIIIFFFISLPNNENNLSNISFVLIWDLVSDPLNIKQTALKLSIYLILLKLYVIFFFSSYYFPLVSTNPAVSIILIGFLYDEYSFGRIL